MEEGDIVNVDVTVYLNGFHGKVLAPLSDHRVNFVQAGSRLLLLYMRSLIIDWNLDSAE